MIPPLELPFFVPGTRMLLRRLCLNSTTNAPKSLRGILTLKYASLSSELTVYVKELSVFAPYWRKSPKDLNSNFNFLCSSD